MKLPRVLVLYNIPVLPPDHADYASEADILEVVGWLKPVLDALAIPYDVLGIGRDIRPLVDRLTNDPPEVVFNLFEGFADQPATEIAAAALLEWFRIPFTGSSAACIALCGDKMRAKHLMAGAGIPTPKYMFVESGTTCDWPHAWPAFVKLAGQDASVGITYANVVRNPAEMSKQIERLGRDYGYPILVEEFIDGREIHLNVVEELDGSLTIVPPSELVFHFKDGRDVPVVYTTQAKWDLESPEYKASEFITPVTLPEATARQLETVARDAFRLFGLRDYARFDVRLSPADEVYVLEANPNPFLFSPTLDDGLKHIGRTHNDFIENMIQKTFQRGNGIRACK